MNTKSQHFVSVSTFVLILGIILYLSYQIASSFLIAILMGGLIAHALKPFQKSRRLGKLSPRLRAGVTFFGLIFVVVLPFILFVMSLIQQAVMFKSFLDVQNLPSMQSLIEKFRALPMMGYFVEDPIQFEHQIKVWATEIGTTLSSLAVKQAAEVPSFLIQTVIILLTCWVFMTEGDRLISWLSEKIPLESQVKHSVLRSFSRSSRSAVWATLLASGTQSAIIFLGFLVLQVPGAVLATGATFIFAFIPFLGATPIWISGAIYLYLQSSMIKMGFMIALGLIAGLGDNVVRAFVLKGPHGLHPLVGLIAIFGGLQVFGVFGVLIGPIVVAILITLIEVLPQVWDQES